MRKSLPVAGLSVTGGYSLSWSLESGYELATCKRCHIAEVGSHIAEVGMYVAYVCTFYRLLALGVGNVPRTAHALTYKRRHITEGPDPPGLWRYVRGQCPCMSCRLVPTYPGWTAAAVCLYSIPRECPSRGVVLVGVGSHPHQGLGPLLQFHALCRLTYVCLL